VAALRIKPRLPRDGSTSARKVIELPPGSGEGVFDRDLDMLVPRVIGRRAIHRDVFVRRDRERDANLETGPVAVLVTGRNYRHAATCNTFAMHFETGDFFQNRLAGGSGRLETFKRNLRDDLHLSLFQPPMTLPQTEIGLKFRMPA